MMTRLMSLTLNNVKNVRHGTVDFPVLASGGSVTGIYGANGSGKTSVIDALALLKQTMSGMPIAASSGELVTIGESSMTLTAVFLMEIQSRHYVKYSVEYRKQDTGLGVRDATNTGNLRNGFRFVCPKAWNDTFMLSSKPADTQIAAPISRI